MRPAQRRSVAVRVSLAGIGLAGPFGRPFKMSDLLTLLLLAGCSKRHVSARALFSPEPVSESPQERLQWERREAHVAERVGSVGANSAGRRMEGVLVRAEGSEEGVLGKPLANDRPENLGGGAEDRREMDEFGVPPLKRPIASADAGQGACARLNVRSAEECVADLRAFPRLDARNPHVRRLACAVQQHLRPWLGIPGVTQGMGTRGLIGQALLRKMAGVPSIMSCCGHVRIVDGKIFFRYGRFEFDWYRMRRFIFSIKMIKDAIATYGLHSLRAEFFLNTCDLPKSKASAHKMDIAGMPFFSGQGEPGSLDILYPDPLDLSPSYFRDGEDEVPWEAKENRAVFRGGSTNYHMKVEQQWRASPRFRLHRMSDVRPDLLDAKVMKSYDDAEIKKGMRADGITLGNRLNASALQRFKYEVAVDGGTGTCRTCGVLASNQLMIRQSSEYFQFYEVLTCPFQHYLPTDRYFSDLFDRIEWANGHSREVKRIIHQANKLASLTCTWEGRRLYWAILLVKYATSAMEDSSQVQRPDKLFQCNHPPAQMDVENGPNSFEPEVREPLCGSEDEIKNESPCGHFCKGGEIVESKWKWLTEDLFDNVEVFKPHNSRLQS